MVGLSVNNIITNEDIVVTYTPSVYYYSYVVIKDGVYGEVVHVYGSNSEIRLTEEGSYKIEVTENGVVSSVGEYVIDKTAPILNVTQKKYTITNKEQFDVSGKVTASDSVDGDLTYSLGYRTMFWSVAYPDWLESNDVGRAVNEVTKNIHNGAIILLHAVSKANSEALKVIIDKLQNQGYIIQTSLKLM